MRVWEIEKYCQTSESPRNKATEMVRTSTSISDISSNWIDIANKLVDKQKLAESTQEIGDAGARDRSESWDSSDDSMASIISERGIQNTIKHLEKQLDTYREQHNAMENSADVDEKIISRLTYENNRLKMYLFGMVTVIISLTIKDYS
jgi:hypothetical protein